MVVRILSLVGKKYSYEIMAFLTDKASARFKDLKKACPIEKMRTQRLKELEDMGLIKSSVKMLGRRPILVYGASDKGKKVAELLEKLQGFNKP